MPFPAVSSGLLFKRLDPLVFVLSVPRQKLKQIFNKPRSRFLPISFQLYIKKPAEPWFTITSVQYCYGKINSAGVQDVTIIEDPKGWQGSCDLHVWGYVDPQLVEMGMVNNYVGVALTPEKEVFKLFRSELGDDLSILEISAGQDPDSIIILEKCPNLQKATGPELMAMAYHENDVAKATTTFIVKSPLLDLDLQVLTTRIDVLGNALASLRNKASISVEQLSTCTLTVKFDTFQVKPNYSYPVDYNTTKLRVSRAQGWIEVTSPILTASRRGRFTSNHFPVVCSGPTSQIHNCFLPYINFCQLPPLEDPRRRHREYFRRMSDNSSSFEDNVREYRAP